MRIGTGSARSTTIRFVAGKPLVFAVRDGEKARKAKRKQAKASRKANR